MNPTFETGLVKCRCQHCNGHIQFESARLDHAGDTALGQTFPCPHCGMETLLYAPSAPLSSNSSASAKRQWLKPLLISIGVLAVLVGLVFLIVGILVGNSVARAAAVGAFWVFAAVLAIYWLLFPLFVYRLLKQIERNTRPRE